MRLAASDSSKITSAGSGQIQVSKAAIRPKAIAHPPNTAASLQPKLRGAKTTP